MSSTRLTRRGRIASAVAVLLIAAGTIAVVVDAGAHAPISTPLHSTTPFAKTACADLVVLGLRGSGQSTSKDQGVGAEVLGSVREMATRLHSDLRSAKTAIRLEAVLFPARYAPTLAAYEAGISTGEKMVRARLTALSSHCPDSHFALIGFSQGANVVHAFADSLTAKQSRRLVLVAMIADPFKNPADTIRAYSYSTSTPGPGKYGVGPLFDRATRDRAITFCVRKDEICNRPADGGPSEVTSTHRTFYEQPATTRQTGRELVRTLRRGTADPPHAEQWP